MSRVSSSDTYRIAIIAVVYWMACAGQTASAQDANRRRDDPSLLSLRAELAAEERPNDRFSLLPPADERSPGNAAVCYYRAVIFYSSVDKEKRDQFDKLTTVWYRNPNARPYQELREWLPLFETPYRELRRGAYRETCDWGHRLRDLGSETYSYRLTELQGMRDLARVLMHKAQLEIADGKLDQALETIRVGMQLGQDIARTPFIINKLVGGAVTRVMLEPVHDLIRMPGGHNYYWALARFPSPVVRIQPALEFEMEIPYRAFELMKTGIDDERTDEQWRAIVEDAWERLEHLGGDTGFEVKKPADMDKFMKSADEVAKRRLLEHGLTKQQVSRMAPGHRIALQAKLSYDHTFETTLRWTRLPFSKGQRPLVDAMQKLKKDGYFGDDVHQRALLPIAQFSMPSLDAAWFADIRFSRHIALLQTVEAVRAHASKHGGPPQKLTDLELPAPLDPTFDRPFEYRVDGDLVVIRSAAPYGRTDDVFSYRVELKLTEPKSRD